MLCWQLLTTGQGLRLPAPHARRPQAAHTAAARRRTERHPTKPQVGGGPGRGIAQWTVGDDRWNALQAFAHRRGHSWTDFRTQVQFVWHELHGTFRAALAALKATSSVAGATSTVMKRYEIPDPTKAQYSKRYALALMIYRRFG
jgi:hypothetical protein